MPKITKLTCSASVKVSQNYNSVESSAQIEIEVEEGDNVSQLRREYTLSLRRQLRAEVEESLSALLDRRPEQALGTSAGVTTR